MQMLSSSVVVVDVVVDVVSIYVYELNNGTIQREISNRFFVFLSVDTLHYIAYLFSTLTNKAKHTHIRVDTVDRTTVCVDAAIYGGLVRISCFCIHFSS